jgi:iron complex outermembrane receptor protein
VITNEDIRRSGMSNVAELLRTVPGVDVAEIDANKWSITTRGFDKRYPDKTLVLLHGRTLYSPLTSGVTWDVQETTLEDIARIEVIRGH